MLNFDYEMRSVPEAFDGIPKLMIQKEVQQYIDHIQRSPSGGSAIPISA
ncbi:hypothetical protein [Bosea sp. F3-2]|nr:hypothetical protein [Bosea sp. F3-2]